MIYQVRVMGVLDLESPQVNYFTEDHEQTLISWRRTWLCRSKNARLYEEVSQGRGAHGARAHGGAASANCSLAGLSPTSITASTSPREFISAREVCGDLYDFLSYGTQQFGRRSGNVSGKGSAAALLWRGGHRNSAQPLSAQAPSPRNFSASSINWCATAAWRAAT